MSLPGQRAISPPRHCSSENTAQRVSAAEAVSRRENFREYAILQIINASPGCKMVLDGRTFFAFFRRQSDFSSRVAGKRKKISRRGETFRDDLSRAGDAEIYSRERILFAHANERYRGRIRTRTIIVSTRDTAGNWLFPLRARTAGRDYSK